MGRFSPYKQALSEIYLWKSMFFENQNKLEPNCMTYNQKEELKKINISAQETYLLKERKKVLEEDLDEIDEFDDNINLDGVWNNIHMTKISLKKISADFFLKNSRFLGEYILEKMKPFLAENACYVLSSSQSITTKSYTAKYLVSLSITRCH